MKLVDLLQGLLISKGRYAKYRVLKEIAGVLDSNWGLGQSSLEKIARGDSSMEISVETKERLMVNWDKYEDKLLDYLETLVDDVVKVASALGVAAKCEHKKRLLCKAVREQFRLFFDPTNTDIDCQNVIPDVYAQLLEKPEIPATVHQVLYPGDEAQDFSSQKNYTMDIYDSVTHVMELQNRGSVYWVNRKLIYVDDNCHVRPSSKAFDIPETGKSGIIKIPIGLAGRGSVGTAILRWRMVDANGADCFPSEPDKFRVTVVTKFNPDK